PRTDCEWSLVRRSWRAMLPELSRARRSAPASPDAAASAEEQAHLPAACPSRSPGEPSAAATAQPRRAPHPFGRLPVPEPLPCRHRKDGPAANQAGPTRVRVPRVEEYGKTVTRSPADEFP